MTDATFSNGHALIIGVGFDLPVSVKDATALHNVLVDPNRATYPQHQVQLLTEDKATRQGILEAFDQLIEQVNKNPDATVIVYFSGHGGRRLNGASEYFLVTHDYAQSRQAEQAISGTEFTKKIEAIKSRKLVVLLDCCHAAGMPAFKDTGEKFVKSPAPPSLLEALNAGRGRVVVASSREDEKSYILQGQPYSVFTTCLLEALAGKAAREQDGFARILDVLTYLIEQVPLRIGLQHPFINNMSKLDENFALCYYAGGKYLPMIEIPIYEQIYQRHNGNTIHDTFKQRKQKQIQEEIQHFDKLQTQITKRIRKIQEALLNETNPKYEDQYENDFEECKEQLRGIIEKIDQLEKQLSELN